MSPDFRAARSALFIVAVFLGIIIFFIPASAQFQFEIGKLSNSIQGQELSIPVTKTSGTGNIDRFSFRIAYNPEMLTLYEITPGEIFNIPGAFEWEYFSYSMDTVTSGEIPNRFRTVSIFGIANLEDGAHLPTSLPIPNGTALFYLNFYSTIDRTFACNFFPVNFIWKGCSDNILFIDGTSDTTGISKNVYSPDNLDIAQPVSTLPTYFGAPEECLGAGQFLNPVRLINLKNGGADMVCSDSAPNTGGDINLNGVYYDPGDAVVYTNYFLHGLGAFTVNVAGQVAASDINRDGTPLTPEDLRKLLKIISGLISPAY
ncbi:MAG: hypothetical protein NT002_00850 [candidate division Zixibacteria bacterium]|nr:hypothetical protein [candidate division Zixibacteria bacterium]